MWWGCAKHLGPRVCDSALNHRWLQLSHRVQRSVVSPGLAGCLFLFHLLTDCESLILAACVTVATSLLFLFSCHLCPHFLLMDGTLICVDCCLCFDDKDIVNWGYQSTTTSVSANTVRIPLLLLPLQGLQLTTACIKYWSFSINQSIF